MIELLKYTDEELRLELNRREEEKRRPPKPVSRKEVNWASVYNLAISLTEDLIKTEYTDTDQKIQLYKEVIDAIYGPKYWEWVRQF